MFSLPRIFTTLVILVAAVALADTAPAQGGNVQLFTLADGQTQDFGGNFGRTDITYTVQNTGTCDIKARWFDKQANKWRERVIKPGKRLRRTIQYGEYFEVQDVVDHSSSKFGVKIQK